MIMKYRAENWGSSKGGWDNEKGGTGEKRTAEGN